jgi:sigma-B regulation protein RsbU (phosphoserine phosphatase)
VCIADVAGKSVRAQARIPLLKYSLRALAPLYAQPEVLVKRLNETLAPDLQPELFIGLCYIVLDPRHATLSWCNAGHIAPLLISHTPSSSGKSTPQPPKIVALETVGPALGMFPGMDYQARTMPWCPRDQLLLLTDGHVDALDNTSEADGEDELRRLATQLDGSSDDAQHPPRVAAQQLVDVAVAALEQSSRPPRLMSQLGASSGGEDTSSGANSVGHRDDITVVVVRYKAEEAVDG